MPVHYVNSLDVSSLPPAERSVASGIVFSSVTVSYLWLCPDIWFVNAITPETLRDIITKSSEHHAQRETKLENGYSGARVVIKRLWRTVVLHRFYSSACVIHSCLFLRRPGLDLAGGGLGSSHSRRRRGKGCCSIPPKNPGKYFSCKHNVKSGISRASDL